MRNHRTATPRKMIAVGRMNKILALNKCLAKAKPRIVLALAGVGLGIILVGIGIISQRSGEMNPLDAASTFPDGMRLGH